MRKKDQKKIIFWSIIGVIVVWFGYSIFTSGSGEPGKYTPFAQCLEQQGVTFYGAFWCPHCERQRAAFGSAKNDLPYVECSNPDRSQTARCTAEGITSYPTWKFADGTVVTGEQSFEELARLSGCQLPL